MSTDVRATYRVQLRREFDFRAAAQIAGYLARLGVSHLYCSPYLQAGPGSIHGYDVSDPRRLSAQLGGEEGHSELLAALEDAGLAHVLDIVPNHMASADNAWWRDVLERGRYSRYASFFDIDWESTEPRLRGKILLPVLGDHYGRVLAAGDLRLDDSQGTAVVRYHEHTFPLAPGSLDASLERVNSDRDALHEVLERQHYRLAYWRTDIEVNYRRFFDIDELVALRVDHVEVFDAVHERILDLVRCGAVEGLRVDHVDGLRDPHAYLMRLRAHAPDAYLIVEKILEAEERIPDDWPVDGTTGYDFLNRAVGILVDPAGEEPLTEIYESFIGHRSDLTDLIRERKLLITETVLASDVERLVARFADACEANLRYRDFTRSELRAAVREVLAALPVYRTYIRPNAAPRPEDARIVKHALAVAADRRPDLDAELFDFLAQVWLLQRSGPAEIEFTLRFQQTSGPVMAKAVEDTAYYNYNRLVCLNEVGGDPETFGISPAEFHRINAQARANRPLSMLATSTHDTKRSEDVRSRIALLSEIPQQWGEVVRRFRAINERYRYDDLPDRNIEYLFYQTVVGAHPLDAERAVAYMVKASREAKQRTSWTDPDPEYDRALEDFVRGALEDAEFLATLRDFVAPLIDAGRVNSLSQCLFKLTCPGVPDIYQGTELWDLSLVDPDNRRPVDYTLRSALLDEVEDASCEAVMADSDSGAPKLWLLTRALALRARRADAFAASSTYEPLQAAGRAADHVVAYARGDRVVAVGVRLPLSLGGWHDTSIRLPRGEWRDVLGERDYSGSVAISDLLDRFPVALLERG